MSRLRGVLFVTVLLGAEVAAVLALHHLGRVDGFAFPRHAVGRWLLDASTEDLVAVTARLAGLVFAWWLLAATLLSLARRAVPGWRRMRALDAMTPAALRGIIDRAMAVGLGASLAFGSVHPAAAAQPAPRRVDVPVVRSAAPPAPPPSKSTRSAPLIATPPAASVVVAAGDNLWVIARRALEGNGGPVAPAEIAPYWRRVIAANAATLRSHDPNLIFPGERVVLPPPGG